MEPETHAESRFTRSHSPGLPETKPADREAQNHLKDFEEPEVGHLIGEFRLLEELGRGAFGRVFRAEQEKLNRHVALKVSRQRAMTVEEGKSLGGLEHDHIVKVYSSFTHEPTGWHCLCLQYVPGRDLRTVIETLHRAGTPPASGRDLIAALDAVGRNDAPFDPASLRDRDALSTDDFPQAVCRLGGRLAEALAFAHARGVLHCDIKPANILLTPYARPMLADFNVAFDQSRKEDKGGLGGTLVYMAPEYLDAIRANSSTGVDGRCDIYSLGVVLHELATGHHPERRSGALDAAPRELATVIRRCLEPDPARRYQSAEELAEALAAAWQLLAARRALPAADRLGRWVNSHPLPALALAGALPHLAASLVNIGFNSHRIELNEEQRRIFMVFVLVYNLVAYPIALVIAVTIFRRVAKPFSIVASTSGPAVDDLRARVCRLGRQASLIGMLGWFPGAVLFPLVIDLGAGPLTNPAAVYAHFAVSFVLSGLIGVIFSFLGVQYVVFRGLLPQLGNPDTFNARSMSNQMRALIAPFGPLVLLASAIPLTGAVLLIVFTDGTLTLGFRVLMAGLIGLGAFGVTLAERTVRRITRLASVWLVSDGAGPIVKPPSPWDSHASGVRRLD